MLVLPLCQRLCPEKLPVELGDKLGDGSDGEVFNIIGQPDRVIKLSILYEYRFEGLSDYENIKRVIEYVQVSKPQPYVHVYEHGYLTTSSRKMVDWYREEQLYLIYYYLMEKLNCISEDEKKLFHSLLSHEDNNKIKSFSDKKIARMLRGMRRGLDFDEEKVILFCQDLKSAPLNHLDLNPRNIMKDNQGNFKLVDLDRCELK